MRIEPTHIIVSADENGMRLDRILATHLQDISRGQLQSWIKDGHVKVERRGLMIGKTTPSIAIQEYDSIQIDPPAIRDTQIRGENIALDILFEDDQLLVLNKPAGLVVHPAPGNFEGTLVNALIHHCGDSLAGIGGERRPGIVHRLDKDTSGVMGVAKTDMAHQALSEQFKIHGRDGRLQRHYIAFVWGNPTPINGTVDAAIARSQHNRLKQSVSKSPDARQAITHYRRLALSHDAMLSKVQCSLETGRTHQIRVHMSHIGHPVVNDSTYGAGMVTRIQKLAPNLIEALSSLHRQALHAAALGFEHPVSKEPLYFEASLPDDLERLDKAFETELST